MLESDLEDEVVDWIDSEGGYALKLKIEGQRGWGDRSLFLPEATFAVAELKRPGKNDRSINQKKWVRRLRELGFPVDFCESLDEVKELVRRARSLRCL